MTKEPEEKPIAKVISLEDKRKARDKDPRSHGFGYRDQNTPKIGAKNGKALGIEEATTVYNFLMTFETSRERAQMIETLLLAFMTMEIKDEHYEDFLEFFMSSIRKNLSTKVGLKDRIIKEIDKDKED